MQGHDAGVPAIAFERAPELLTERLRLRPHVVADYPACRALWQHPETIRFIGGKAQSDQDVWFRLLRYGGMWPLQGFGFWAIEDRAGGGFLGEGGLMDAQRGLAGLNGMPEAGWALMPQASGRGIATEAMRAVLGWADAHLSFDRTGCIISPDNRASLRVAAKLGFIESARPGFHGEPIVLLHRSKGFARAGQG